MEEFVTLDKVSTKAIFPNVNFQYFSNCNFMFLGNCNDSDKLVTELRVDQFSL